MLSFHCLVRSSVESVLCAPPRIGLRRGAPGGRGPASEVARFAAAALGALFVTAGAQGRLLTNADDWSAATLTVGFDATSAARALPAGQRVAVPDLPGVTLGVQALNGSLRMGPADDAWSLGSNGQWLSGRSYAGVDGGADSEAQIYAALIFDFGSEAVQRVGAFINYNPDYTYAGSYGLPLYLAAYDARGQLLDSHEVQIQTPGGSNGGHFYGIATSGASIARFEVSAPYAVVDSLRFTTPVPEAPAWLLVVAGLPLLGALRRKEQPG